MDILLPLELTVSGLGEFYFFDDIGDGSPVRTNMINLLNACTVHFPEHLVGAGDIEPVMDETVEGLVVNTPGLYLNKRFADSRHARLIGAISEGDRLYSGFYLDGMVYGPGCIGAFFDQMAAIHLDLCVSKYLDPERGKNWSVRGLMRIVLAAESMGETVRLYPSNNRHDFELMDEYFYKRLLNLAKETLGKDWAEGRFDGVSLETIVEAEGFEFTQ